MHHTRRRLAKIGLLLPLIILNVYCNLWPTPPVPPTGSCCAADGACTVTAQADCTATWTESGTCDPNPCQQPPPTGSCCAADGACTVTTQAACAGTWTSGGSCTPNPCPQPLKIAPGEGGETPDLSALNLVALHKGNSPQYDGQCLKCHADVLTAAALDPNIETGHQVMIPTLTWLGYDPQVGVKNSHCRLCHGTASLTPEGPLTNLRRTTPVVLCDVCHGPQGTPPFYQE